MSIPNRQIGWSDRTNILQNILKELRAIRNQVGVTPPTAPTPPTTSNTTTNP